MESLFIDYGQRAGDRERSAAECIARHYDLDHRELHCLGAAPKGHGYIRGRNAFLVLAALQELQYRSGSIAIGIHAGTGYVDCTPEFLDLARWAVNLYTAGEVRLIAPFLTWSKRDILRYALEAGVPIHLTYSCELGSAPPCGSCKSCRDRSGLEAL